MIKRIICKQTKKIEKEVDYVLEILFPVKEFNYSFELKQQAEKKVKEAIKKGNK